MAFDFGKKSENEEKNCKRGAEERFTAGAQLPNSLIMRIMEDPAAEQEANRLSSGITSRTPETLMREMGGRLGADFSSVRFHNDPDSLAKSRAMGARAWAQGRDVYFGRGGFEPSVAAHELVHTVQQGAVKGNVSRSMPMGTVQLLPGDEDDKIKIKENDDDDREIPDMPGNDATEVQGLESGLLFFFRNPDSASIASEVTSRMKSMLKSKFGRKINYDATAGIRFLVRACYRDYALREILQEVVAAPAATKAEKKSRIRDYKGLIKTLSSRLTPADAQQLAAETGMFTGTPDFTRVRKPNLKRAYDTEAGADGLVDFNPEQIPELTKIQTAIDRATSPEQAYSIFAEYAGNNARYKDNYKKMKVDLRFFKAKLKHMARVITDYPELKYHIGDMNVIDPNSKTLMSTTGTRGGQRAITLQYNKQVDKAGIWGDLERDIEDEKDKTDPFHISPRQYHGTHELGHALASTLVEDTGNRQKWYKESTIIDRMKRRDRGEETPTYPGAGMTMTNQVDEEENELPENDMLETVLFKNKRKMIKRYNISNLAAFKSDTKLNGHSFLKDMLITQDMHELGMTSKYGSFSAGEMFAEAVADVYSHGSGAKEMSKELVKEYESRHKKKVREQFKENRKSWWQRLFGL